MTQPDVSIIGGTIRSGDRRFDLAHPVMDAWWYDELLIVLLDPDAKKLTSGQFPNLLALDLAGKTVWVAELPTTVTGDRYYRAASRTPIVVNSVMSFDCEIDEHTGKIRRKEFTK